MEWNELKKGMEVVPIGHLGRELSYSTAKMLKETGYLIIKNFKASFEGEPIVVLSNGNFYRPEELRPFTSFRPESITLNLDTPEKMALFLSLFTDEDIVEDLDRNQGGKVFSELALRKAFNDLVSFDEWLEISNKLEKII